MLDDQIILKQNIKKNEKSLALIEQKVVSKESSNKKYGKMEEKLRNKIMYSSLMKSCDKLPKTK